MIDIESVLNDTQMRYLSLLLEAGCKFKYKTVLFDKEYVWMTGPKGEWFLERLPQEQTNA